MNETSPMSVNVAALEKSSVPIGYSSSARMAMTPHSRGLTRATTRQRMRELKTKLATRRAAAPRR